MHSYDLFQLARVTCVIDTPWGKAHHCPELVFIKDACTYAELYKIDASQCKNALRLMIEKNIMPHEVFDYCIDVLNPQTSIKPVWALNFKEKEK